MLKVYLDDIRKPEGNGWVIFRNAPYCISFLKNYFNQVEEISLDHDLGDEKIYGCGNDVLLFIEEYVITNNLKKIPKIHVHSSNASAREKMELGIRALERRVYGE